MTQQTHPISWLIGSSLTAAALALGVIGISLSLSGTGYADDNHELQQTITPNPEYTAECGSCHMAYPPTLLPADKWRAITANLADHFGDNASLAPQVSASIEAYLVQQAAQHGKVMKHNVPLPAGAGPQRITEQAFFIRKHDEIPRHMVQDNPKVGSFSQCSTCHNLAEKGIFDEDTVNIPGVGRWND